MYIEIIQSHTDWVALYYIALVINGNIMLHGNLGYGEADIGDGILLSLIEPDLLLSHGLQQSFKLAKRLSKDLGGIPIKLKCIK